MKKLLVFFVLIASTNNLFAAAIHDYNGQKHALLKEIGEFVINYALKKDIPTDFSPAIHDNKLYFIGGTFPVNDSEILKRGYVQSGDKFLLSKTFPDVLAVYQGPRKEIKNSFIAARKVCWGIGYSVYGGEIIITELILSDEELEKLKQTLK
jgi:hypothetical protein